MEALYNIYYAGEVLEGHDTAGVRPRLGKLFKANEATLDKLFSGKPQLLKRDCDKATALKYKQAMEQAGARPVITAANAQAPAAQPASRQPPAPAPAPKKQSTAERIAALAAAPDLGYGGTAPGPASGADAPPPDGRAEAAGEDAGFGLDPAQGELLRPEEREQVEAVEVDISALSAEGGYDRLEADAAPAPPAPDTGHLSVGEVGESIPNLAPQHAPLSPDTSALQLSPEGTDFSDCSGPEAPVPDLDLSAIGLAPEGSDVLESQYRDKAAPPPPPTDHISVEE